MLHVMLDNGHGEDTPGKCSPDKSLREYKWAREVTALIAGMLKEVPGVQAHIITPEIKDVLLGERCRRINVLCDKYGTGNCLSISVHINAADGDGLWHTARGFSVFVSGNAGVRSKKFAQQIYGEAERRGMRGNRSVPKERYWVKSLAMCRNTKCAAVLTENMFMDNRTECEWLKSAEGKRVVAEYHVAAIKAYGKEQGLL